MSRMKVTLLMPLEAGRRLQAMCLLRGISAAELIEQWVEAHDERGYPKKRRGLFDEVMGGIFGDD